MSIVKKLKFSDLDILFFGTVKGLVSERNQLRTAFESFLPEYMLVGISPEEKKGLFNYMKEPFEIDPADYEIIYAKKLERFGEVGLPVPTYLEAYRISIEHGIDMIPVDMPDDIYSNLYTKKVDFFRVMRYDMRKRKIWKRRFHASTPEEFVIEWDGEVNKIREFMEIEREREAYMAGEISSFIMKHSAGKIIAIIELERLNGVLSKLKYNKTKN